MTGSQNMETILSAGDRHSVHLMGAVLERRISTLREFELLKIDEGLTSGAGFGRGEILLQGRCSTTCRFGSVRKRIRGLVLLVGRPWPLCVVLELESDLGVTSAQRIRRLLLSSIEGTADTW